MRWINRALLAPAALLCCAPLHASETASELPLRKAGLWRVLTETDEGRGVQSQQLTMCIGDQMEKKTVNASTSENRSNCSKYEIRKTQDATVVDATCTYDARQVTTHTELKGDFKTTFVAVVVSHVAGMAPRAMGGQPVDVHRTIRQEGTYLGESCGELQAGEAKTASGRTVSVQ